MMNFYETMDMLNLTNWAIWTTSDKNKAPMNAKAAVKNHFNRQTWRRWFSHATGAQDLVTLSDLINEPQAPLHSLALALNVNTQGIVAIDMEKDFDPSAVYYLKRIPAIYGEWSKHRGQHYLVKVSARLLHDPKYQSLFSKSSVKFAQTNEPHSGVEMFMRQHYITFTQDQVSLPTDNTEADMRVFLDYVLHRANTNSCRATDYLGENAQQTIQSDVDAIYNHGLTKYNKATIRRQIDNNQEPDDSMREYQDIFCIARCLVRNSQEGFRQMPFSAGELKDADSMSNPSVLAQVLLDYTYDYLDPRPKWNRKATRSQEYIQYTVNKALNYALKHVRQTA